jgi:hypothetical protein
MPLHNGLRHLHGGGVAEVSSSRPGREVVASRTAGGDPIAKSASRARRLQPVARPKGSGHKWRAAGGTPRSSAAERAAWSGRRLTPRSTGAATAGHQARSTGTLYILGSPGLAAYRCRPVSSNVRRLNARQWRSIREHTLMGLFDNLVAIHHRVAATAIRDYATSLKTTELEQSFSKMVNVEIYKYVGERIYLLSALSRYILYLRAQETQGHDIRAASGFLERLLDEYFAKRPGIDGNLGTYHWHLARDDFVLDTSEDLALRFLIRVTDGRLSREQMSEIPRYQELINLHISQTQTLVLSSTAKLK